MKTFKTYLSEQFIPGRGVIKSSGQAMEYEKLWHHNVTTFYTWTLWKLNDPILIHILHILLKKEYSHINSYDQYFALLECNGDETIFKEKMKKYDHKK